MGSSRASTPAGRTRAAQRASARAGGSKSKRRPATRAPSAGRGRRTAAPKARKPPAPKRRKTAPQAGRPASRPRARARKAPGRKPTRAGGAFSVRSVALLLLAVVGLAAAYQLWFRDSSFVAIERVSVEGMSGPQEEQVVAALRDAAGTMTTLNVDEEALSAAVARFATVVEVSADADFPHGLAITVTDRPPMLVAAAGDRALPVAGDGTVLPGVELGKEQLPAIEVGELPASGRLTGDPLGIALVVGAAPEPLRELIEDVSTGGKHGVEVTMRGGIPLFFGEPERAADKWSAAAAVLADPKIDTLTYLDVRVPERPAVGGAAPPVTDTTTETSSPAVSAGALGG